MARFSLFARAVAVLSALLAPVYAQVAFTNSDYSGITAGNSFVITWTGDGTDAKIQLRTGLESNLQVVADIATTSQSFYSWTPSSDFKTGTYALSISQSGHDNYSPKFAIAGATGTKSVMAPGITDMPLTVRRAQLAPTYVASGGLTCENTTWPYYATANGTGVALPTGTNGLGQYTYFRGAASRGTVSAGVIGVALLVASIY